MKSTARHLRCDKCRRPRNAISVAACKHPAVTETFGNYICMYCCCGCRHHIQYTARDHGLSAIACGYSKEEKV